MKESTVLCVLDLRVLEIGGPFLPIPAPFVPPPPALLPPILTDSDSMDSHPVVRGFMQAFIQAFTSSSSSSSARSSAAAASSSAAASSPSSSSCGGPEKKRRVQQASAYIVALSDMGGFSTDFSNQLSAMLSVKDFLASSGTCFKAHRDVLFSCRRRTLRPGFVREKWSPKTGCPKCPKCSEMMPLSSEFRRPTGWAFSRPA